MWINFNTSLCLGSMVNCRDSWFTLNGFQYITLFRFNIRQTEESWLLQRHFNTSLCLGSILLDGKKILITNKFQYITLFRFNDMVIGIMKDDSPNFNTSLCLGSICRLSCFGRLICYFNTSLCLGSMHLYRWAIKALILFQYITLFRFNLNLKY